MRNSTPVAIGMLTIVLAACSSIPSEQKSESGATSPPPSVHTYSILDPARVTKKPFGIFIDPKTSPVQPERFRGYHTGTDFETTPGDPEIFDVPAFCEGKVVYAATVSGYGGVLVERCTLGGEDVTVLYGHLAVSSLKTVGSVLSVGQTLGRLGNGYSKETDFERKHLHLSIHRGTAIELRGYVQNKSELSGWIDPLMFFRQ